MRLTFQSPPFRVRAVTLALWAAVMGLAALVLALTDEKKPLPTIPIPTPSAEPAWPEGFVEWQDVEGALSAAPATPTGAATAQPSTSAAAPHRSSASASTSSLAAP